MSATCLTDSLGLDKTGSVDVTKGIERIESNNQITYFNNNFMQFFESAQRGC